MIFDDENFDDGSGCFIPKEEFEEDAALSEIEIEKIKIFQAMKTFVEKVIENINFKEKSEEEKNTRIISFYCSSIINLNELEKEKLSDDEILEAIKDFKKSVEEFSYFDIEKYEKEEEKMFLLNKKEDEKKDDNDSSFDI